MVFFFDVVNLVWICENIYNVFGLDCLSYMIYMLISRVIVYFNNKMFF